MYNAEAKVIRPAKKLSAQEKQEIFAWLDELQTWAKSVGLTERDIEDSIRAVRQRKRQTKRQSA